MHKRHTRINTYIGVPAQFLVIFRVSFVLSSSGCARHIQSMLVWKPFDTFGRHSVPIAYVFILYSLLAHF